MSRDPAVKGATAVAVSPEVFRKVTFGDRKAVDIVSSGHNVSFVCDE